MLILTRRKGEKILIGNDVWLVVHRVNGNQVRLGIDAPLHVRINRKENHKNNSNRGQSDK